MTHIIAQPCIGTKDTACVAVCPVDCIHPTKEEATFESADMLYIDPDTCIDCGLCQHVCPVNAIFPEDELPAGWAGFAEKNAAHFRPPASAPAASAIGRGGLINADQTAGDVPAERNRT